MEWNAEFIDNYKSEKKKRNWQVYFDVGRKAGFFNTFANSQSLKNTFNSLKSKNKTKQNKLYQ